MNVYLPESSFLAQERITDLPEELLSSIRDALRGGYMTRLKELIESEADYHPELSNHLLKLIDNFDYDSLSTLILDDEFDKKDKHS